MGMTTDESQDVESHDVESAQPNGSREGTAERLRADEWPLRPLDASVSGRTDKFQVVFGRGVVEDIRAHGKSSPDIEVCGVLVGNIYRDRAEAYCYVEANIRGSHAAGRNAQVTFTSETWTQIHETMDARYPDRRIVGWYHTHPGFGIFLSEMDLFIHKNFFSELWQVAYVDDPKGGDRGVFVWNNGSVVREQYLVENDVRPVAKTPAPAPRMVWDDLEPEDVPQVVPPSKKGNDSEPPVGANRKKSTEAEPPLEWTARWRALERELRRQKIRMRWLAALAALWPLAILAALFWTGVLPREKLNNLAPKHLLHHWAAVATGPFDRN